jgi:4-hydroxy-2-oxoheptanedioate aldolase
MNMKTRPSRILSLFKKGTIGTVQKINLADPRVIEIAALSGVDAVWLCNEHVPNDWLGLEGQIRAARIHDIDTLVRVSRGSYSDYIRPLEADATGIIVPHVTTSDEARQIVSWVRFHPHGKRALDGGNADGQYCHLPIDEYIRHSNEERLIILQIESPEAMENLNEIAAVPGINGLMFGPGDYSHRIGKPGQHMVEEVAMARKLVAQAAHRCGLFAIASGLSAGVPVLLAEGHRIFGIGADVIALSNYAKQRLDLVRSHTKSLALK